MKWDISSSSLNEIIWTVGKTAAKTSQIKILENIFICAEPGKVVFRSSDSVNTIEYIDTNINVIESGSIALNARLLSEIVKKLPNGRVSIKTDTHYTALLFSGKTKVSIQGCDADGFPSMPDMDNKYSFTINGTALKKVIQKTAPFAAIKGRRSVLEGVLFEVENGALTAMASDSYRMAVVKEKVEDANGAFKIVIPALHLNDIQNFISDKKVHVSVDDRRITMSFSNSSGTFKCTTRLIDGTHLDYKRIINFKPDIRAVVNRHQLMECAGRMNILIEAGMNVNKNPIILEIKKDGIAVSTINQAGSVNETLKTENNGEITIGFNCQYLIQTLKACDNDELILNFTSPTAGMFISSKGDGNYRFMILPVKLYN